MRPCTACVLSPCRATWSAVLVSEASLQPSWLPDDLVRDGTTLGRDSEDWVESRVIVPASPGPRCHSEAIVHPVQSPRVPPTPPPAEAPPGCCRLRTSFQPRTYRVVVHRCSRHRGFAAVEYASRAPRARSDHLKATLMPATIRDGITQSLACGSQRQEPNLRRIRLTGWQFGLAGRLAIGRKQIGEDVHLLLKTERL